MIGFLQSTTFFLLLILGIGFLVLLIAIFYYGIQIPFRKQTQVRKRFLVSLISELVIILSLVIITPLNDKLHAEAITEEFCRLDGFPSWRTDEQYENTGGIFTEGAKMSFNAPPEEIRQWIRRSPGLQEATTIGNEINRTFKVKPEKALFCEVKIDFEKGAVRIDSFWS